MVTAHYTHSISYSLHHIPTPSHIHFILYPLHLILTSSCTNSNTCPTIFDRAATKLNRNRSLLINQVSWDFNCCAPIVWIYHSSNFILPRQLEEYFICFSGNVKFSIIVQQVLSHPLSPVPTPFHTHFILYSLHLKLTSSWTPYIPYSLHSVSTPSHIHFIPDPIHLPLTSFCTYSISYSLNPVPTPFQTHFIL